MGSGNIVHNLRMVAWDKMNDFPYGFDWAKEANNKVKLITESGNFDSLFDYKTLGPEMNRAILTPDHFLLLLYILALKEKNESVEFFNNQLMMGSLSMLSLKIY